MAHLICAPLNPHFPFPQQGLALLCAGVPGGSSHLRRQQFLQTTPEQVFPPAYPSKNVSVNPICSCIESHRTQWLPTKYSKKAAPGPCWWFGRGGSVWASPTERANSSFSPETQLGCTSDQQQVTRGQRTKSHLYSLLHCVSLHYLRENMFSSTLYSFPFALNPCCGQIKHFKPRFHEASLITLWV